MRYMGGPISLKLKGLGRYKSSGKYKEGISLKCWETSAKVQGHQPGLRFKWVKGKFNRHPGKS